jgi:transcriptional regulator with XRE-family HTH domain
MVKKSEFAEAIKILRVKQGMNQTELGKYLGVGQAAVSAMETGENTPRRETLEKMGNLAPYPDCLFFYEKAGMDLKRITAVSNALARCLDFVKYMDLWTHEGLRGRILGLDREEQLNIVLESMGHLPRLVPTNSRFLDEVVPAVLQFVEDIDPAAATELRPHVGGYDSAALQIGYMRTTAAKVLHLKKKKHPRDRE